MQEAKKYIFENGVMKLNPAYQAQQNQTSTVAEPDKALATVSSTKDIINASDAHVAATGEPMHLAESTTASMEIIQDKEFLDDFHSPQKLEGGELLDSLSNIFAKYEVPIGLVNKLLALKEYTLNFIIDDSGSMAMLSDALAIQATDYMKKENINGRYLTRWQEAQDRLHIMLDMLAFIPSGEININFLNRSDKIILNHHGKTPQQFAVNAHQEISNKFNKSPNGGTPIYARLFDAFSRTKTPTMHYLFTDGVPDNGSRYDIEKITNLVIQRNAANNPLTFISCTDQDQETEWMKNIDSDTRTRLVAEIDDFVDEREEVLGKQGPALPFSKGFWILCQLVGALNPQDLDAIDEAKPLTKKTLNDLMGRKLSEQEYKYYFINNPMAQKYYSHLYDQFKREDILATSLPDLHNRNSAKFYGSNNSNATLWQVPQGLSSQKIELLREALPKKEMQGP